MGESVPGRRRITWKRKCLPKTQEPETIKINVWSKSNKWQKQFFVFVCVSCVFSLVYMLRAVNSSSELQLPKDPGMFMGLFWSACAPPKTCHPHQRPPFRAPPPTQIRLSGDKWTPLKAIFQFINTSKPPQKKTTHSLILYLLLEKKEIYFLAWEGVLWVEVGEDTVIIEGTGQCPIQGCVKLVPRVVVEIAQQT